MHTSVPSESGMGLSSDSASVGMDFLHLQYLVLPFNLHTTVPSQSGTLFFFNSSRTLFSGIGSMAISGPLSSGSSLLSRSFLQRHKAVGSYHVKKFVKESQ